ncbi:MAG: deoxynucleoside kinase [Methylomonas sp.]|jgi:deoxyadenosine kinase|uniref:deoxynucleoside kinase n=1 Tax=Methylomonas sp. TaxID=418 RepID=UPI0025CF366D|nr:deoxynucleoside kinase [Methylomonas sp.]MCK9608516.1 deoxynucleoside kinase [Methylomonas sp.]
MATISVNVPRGDYAEIYRDRRLFLAVSGLIASGKTSLVQQLSAALHFTPIYEPVKENVYLPLFYKDMAKFGFPMQVYLLNERFRQHQSIVWSGESSVQDRSIYEDPIFASMLHDSGNISDLDFATYSSLFSNMCQFLHRPDIILYLDVTPETAFARMQKRGRECEKDVSLDYLRSLRDGYESWIKDIRTRIPVVRIDWNADYLPLSTVIDAIKSADIVRKLPITF